MVHLKDILNPSGSCGSVGAYDSSDNDRPDRSSEKLSLRDWGGGLRAQGLGL